MAKQINVKEELIQKGLAEGGLVAFARSNNGMTGALLGGAIGSAIQMASAENYAVVKFQNKIIILPYTKDKVVYEKAETFAKDDISKVKLTWTGKFKIVMKNGLKRVVYIQMFKRDLKEMLVQLGLLN